MSCPKAGCGRTKTETHSVSDLVNILSGKTFPARCPELELEPGTPKPTSRANTAMRSTPASLSLGACEQLSQKVLDGTRRTEVKCVTLGLWYSRLEVEGPSIRRWQSFPFHAAAA